MLRRNIRIISKFLVSASGRAEYGPILAIILYCLFLACGDDGREKQQNALAHCDDVTVTSEEFIKRFELTPRTRQFVSSDEAKRAALMSLVVEKILAREGSERGFGSQVEIQRVLREIEREAVIEQIYREKVRSQVKISEAEIRDAYKLSKHVMRVQYLVVRDSFEAQQIEEMLEGGVEFQEVARQVSPDLIDDKGKLPTKTMEWGKSDERLERAALPLKAGEVSEPIQIGDRTFFLHMEDHLVDQFQSPEDYQQQRPRLKKVISNRKEGHVFARYLNNLMADSQVRVDPELYGWMVQELESLLNLEPGSETRLLREEIEWSQVTSDLEDHLKATLLTFKTGSWTVGEFLERLWFGSYPLNTKTKSDFRAGFYQTIRRMIEDEFMAREGYQQELDQRPLVRNEVRIWKESLVAARMRKALTDTIDITSAQLQSHFDINRERFGEPERVKIQEILVQDEAFAQQLFEAIRNGADMDELARKHSRRKQGRENGGILDLIGRNAHGKLGQAASRAQVGELVGPVQIGPHAFSVFNVLERKPRKNPIFEEVKKDVKSDLLQARSQMAIKKFVINLMKASLQIDQEALEEVEVSSVNLLTLKLGFPGRPAAPMIHYIDGLDEELILVRNDQ